MKTSPCESAWGSNADRCANSLNFFMLAGSNLKAYSSLSEIAKAITGTKWNGPRFFGLRGKKQAEAELPGWMIATGEPAVPRRPRVLKTAEAAP